MMKQSKLFLFIGVSLLLFAQTATFAAKATILTPNIDKIAEEIIRGIQE